VNGTGLTLVMPMAGRGSRFKQAGVEQPKPLVDLAGRPFFWWAVESVTRAVPVRALVFIVLDEHRREYQIDQRIRAWYPHARIVALPDVTSGAAETARIGVDVLSDDAPIAINDCDHAFLCPELATSTAVLSSAADRGLLCFASQSDVYSYVVFDSGGQAVGTVEKRVVSPWAIAGCYLFRSAEVFRRLYAAYERDCPYGELFISGMFNQPSDEPSSIATFPLAKHWSFGTPAELRSVEVHGLNEAFKRGAP
jgi:CTP:molybdopterin cytidylyltransferase MocA